jgi:nucleoside-diphosphate-sugar epimerase
VRRILVTGAAGQIGSELTLALREAYGNDNVIAVAHVTKPNQELLESGPCAFFDCTQAETTAEIISRYKVDTIYHLASLLSAVGEKDPQKAWDVNMNGLLNVLEAARDYKCAVFYPSSIAAFSPIAPKDKTPQVTLQRPDTIYGITKVAGELLCDYYFKRFGVDTRGVRYPGLISYKTPPGGGTTDYAVQIYYDAVQGKTFTCYLKPGTYLDMMYMPDAIKAAIQLMEADPGRLKYRNAYNVTAMSFAPEIIAAQIQQEFPTFKIEYQIDPLRQAIADAWPNSMDDSAARQDWNWRPEYDLQSMTKDMIENLSLKLLGKQPAKLKGEGHPFSDGRG